MSIPQQQTSILARSSLGKDPSLAENDCSQLRSLQEGMVMPTRRVLYPAQPCPVERGILGANRQPRCPSTLCVQRDAEVACRPPPTNPFLWARRLLLTICCGEALTEKEIRNVYALGKARRRRWRRCRRHPRRDTGMQNTMAARQGFFLFPVPFALGNMAEVGAARTLSSESPPKSLLPETPCQDQRSGR